MTAIPRLQSAPVVEPAPKPSARRASTDDAAVGLLFGAELASAQRPPSRESRGAGVGSDGARDRAGNDGPAATKRDAVDADAPDGAARDDAASSIDDAAETNDSAASESSEGEPGASKDQDESDAAAPVDALPVEPLSLAATGDAAAAGSAQGAAGDEPAQAGAGIQDAALKRGAASAASQPVGPTPLTTAGLDAQVTAEASGDAEKDSANSGKGNQHAAGSSAHNAASASATASTDPAVAGVSETSPGSNDHAERLNPLSQSQTQAAQATPPAGAQDAGGDDELNSARLSRGLRSAVNQQGGSITLRLTPPEMGTVRIQLQMQGTSVTARFHAEGDGARHLLQQQLGQLRASLESHGLTVDRLSVQTMTGSSASQFSGADSDSASSDGRSRGQFTQQQGGRQSSPDQSSDGRPQPDDFAEHLTAPAPPTTSQRS